MILLPPLFFGQRSVFDVVSLDRLLPKKCFPFLPLFGNVDVVVVVSMVILFTERWDDVNGGNDDGAKSDGDLCIAKYGILPQRLALILSLIGTLLTLILLFARLLLLLLFRSFAWDRYVWMKTPSHVIFIVVTILNGLIRFVAWNWRALCANFFSRFFLFLLNWFAFVSIHKQLAIWMAITLIV